MIRKIINANLVTSRVHLALLLYRISFGAMMLTHGFPKFQRLVQGNLKFGDPIGIGGELSFVLVVIAEFFGALMVIFGLGTRIGAFLLSFTMIVAGFVRHADDPFSSKEKAFMYLAVFLILLLTGPGKYSIDHKWTK